MVTKPLVSVSQKLSFASVSESSTKPIFPTTTSTSVSSQTATAMDSLSPALTNLGLTATTLSLNPKAPVFVSGIPATTSTTWSGYSAIPATHAEDHTSESDTQPQVNNLSGPQQVLDLAKCFAEQVSLSRLPPPEPSTFSGDPLQYPGWKSSFEALIEHKGIPASERFHYLRKYLAGAAKEAIEGFCFLMTEDAFQEAKALLQKRYGDPFVVANAFRDKLEAWPKIANRDGLALRKLSDFLRQCDTAMRTIDSLKILNDERENKKLLMKLPDWLVNRWSRVVADARERDRAFPLFGKFVEFLVKEANIACDPITSQQALKTDKVSDQEKGPASSQRRKRAPGANSFSTETSEADKSNKRSCPLHDGKTSHKIGDCKIFLAKSLDDKKKCIRENGLCFGCLEKGHRSKFCKQKDTCKVCQKPHPTALHGDVWKPAVKEEASSRETKVTPTKNDSLSEKKEQEKKSSTKTSQDTVVSHLNDTGKSSKCSMIVPVWVSHCDKPENERLVYALLDTQSDTTFILDDTREALGLDGPDTKLLLSTMLSKNQAVDSKRISGLMVRGHNSDSKIQLPTAFTREIMPANRSHIPTPQIAQCWPHLERISDQLMPLRDCEVGLLIGYNCPRALAPRDVISPTNDAPYGQKTDLGWGIVGIVDPTQIEGDAIGISHRVVACEVPQSLTTDSSQSNKILLSLQTSIKEVINPVEVVRMFELDFSEKQQGQTAISMDDQKFLKKVGDGIHLVDGHYEMPLPFRETEPSLPNNKTLALHRLKQLENRLKKDEVYSTHYNAFMDGIIRHDFAERVPEKDLERQDSHMWYIPHHGVYHPKKPGKIRVVFDCSAKHKGVSLNDHLLQGPDLTNALTGVLCRMRQEPVAFMCDIEQMFHQFKVNQEHRDFLRFLWWEDGNTDLEPVEYRMKVHLFGAASSPGCANYGLKQTANDNESEYGTDVATFVKRDFYVDDGLKSVSTEKEAINLVRKSKDLCAKGGLRLHKFISNSKTVLESIPKEDHAAGVKDLDLLHDALPLERALGVQWCIESDTFQFRITLSDKPLTRRGILSTLCSVYDPLGFVAPVILAGKMILQEACREQIDWDSPIPDSLRTRWAKWRDDLVNLDKVEINRCFKPEGFGAIQSAELHHFSDASMDGYGQCSYLRLVDDQSRVHCSLVMGKARVTPLKPVTIPRLELTAALVSVKISASLRQELEYEITTETFWTDSMVVLGYIANDSKRFHVFVANRVQQIRDHTTPSQWKHVKTAENPADDASRGLSVDELVHQSKSLTGPDFLWKTELPSNEDKTTDLEVSTDDPEVKRVQTFASQADEETDKGHILERLEYFSDWNRAKRAVAVCLKFKKRLRNHEVKKPKLPKKGKTSQKNIQLYEPLTVEDIREAEHEIIKHVQRVSFKEEVDTLKPRKADKDTPDPKVTKKQSKVLKGTSSVYRLDPFLDDNGVMRVGGRIRKAACAEDVKHPVILPRKHHITELVVRHCHQQTQHQGRGMTTNEIRTNGFWVLGCSSAVSSCIFRCVKCRKLRARVQEQKMADLPKDRLEPAPPFTYCGVDYFGPWYIKEGRKELKRYGALFTCMASRAVHIETANSLETDAFINALRRFISLRGPIRLLRSDQGTNFVGAKRELKEALQEMDPAHLQRVLSEEGCDFEFKMNVPSASHRGGVWERQIRTVRSILGSLMDQAGSQLNDESLRTLMCEATAIINSRPLTTENLNDPNSPEPLTPNHLLTTKSKIVLPPPGEFQRADLYLRKRWRRVQHLANEFWSRWRKEFLQNIQVRQRWVRPRRDLRIGDVVIIKDDNLPRNCWQLGRVDETVHDDDGHVRRVKLANADRSLNVKGKRVKQTAYLERPIQKLVLLVEDSVEPEIPVEEPCDNDT